MCKQKILRKLIKHFVYRISGVGRTKSKIGFRFAGRLFSTCYYFTGSFMRQVCNNFENSLAKSNGIRTEVFRAIEVD